MTHTWGKRSKSSLAQTVILIKLHSTKSHCDGVWSLWSPFCPPYETEHPSGVTRYDSAWPPLQLGRECHGLRKPNYRYVHVASKEKLVRERSRDHAESMEKVVATAAVVSRFQEGQPAAVGLRVLPRGRGGWYRLQDPRPGEAFAGPLSLPG